MSKPQGKKSTRKTAPATTEDGRESQLISLAVDLAEKQILDGTASSQVITHFLKLGSSKEKIQKDILHEEKKLITARTKAMASGEKQEKLYTAALDAMRAYSGNTEQPVGDDEVDD